MYFTDGNHVHVFENRWDQKSDHNTYFGNYTSWTYFKAFGNQSVFTANGFVNLIDDPSSPDVPIDPKVRQLFTGQKSEFWNDGPGAT